MITQFIMTGFKIKRINWLRIERKRNTAPLKKAYFSVYE